MSPRKKVAGHAQASDEAMEDIVLERMPDGCRALTPLTKSAAVKDIDDTHRRCGCKGEQVNST